MLLNRRAIGYFRYYRLLSNAATNACEGSSIGFAQDLLASLPTAIGHSHSQRQLLNPSLSNIQSLASLIEYIDTKKELTPNELIDIIHIAGVLPEPKQVAKAIDKLALDAVCVNKLLPDQIIPLLIVLLRMDLHQSNLFSNLIEECISHDENGVISISDCAQFVAHSSDKFTIPPIIYNRLKQNIIRQASCGVTCSEVLTLLQYWQGSEREILDVLLHKSFQLIPLMSSGEMCSLVRILSDKKLRRPDILHLMAHHITLQESCLTSRQLVNLADSICSLSFVDARVQRKIVKDLTLCVNTISNWNDVSSLINSLSRMRLGDSILWKRIAAWVNAHHNNASIEQLSLAVSGLAYIGVKEAQPAAKILSQRLKRSSVLSQKSWISAVHSLAFYRCLESDLAEHVLNNLFVAQLMKDKSNVSKLYFAKKLLEITGCISLESDVKYSGPLVTLSSLQPFIDLNTSVELAKEVKYGKKGVAAYEKDFLQSILYRIGPVGSHIQSPSINQFGTLVDAQIIPVKKEGDDCRILVRPITSWTTNDTPKPILYYAWKQTKMLDSLEKRIEENVLLGGDQLSLRLMRSQGLNPIVILESDLKQFSSIVEQLNFAQSKMR